MDTYVCSVNEIHDLNKTKEYTLIATTLLEKLLTDSNLLPEATKLWQLLYNRARFNNNLELQISYKNLSEILGKSTRSIIRYIANLVEHHYLQIQNNFDTVNGQTMNTIFIRFPKIMIDQIKSIKNREVSNKINDIVVRGSSDNNVTPNNIKNINNNNNNVVVHSIQLETISEETLDLNSSNSSSTEELKLTQQLTCIQNLEHELTILEKQLSKALSTTERYDLLTKIGEINAAIAVQNHALEHTKKQISNNITEKETQHKLSESIDFINQEPGIRQIPGFTFKRLQKSVEEIASTIYSTTAITRLVNEIVYEVRFGTLVQSKVNKQELPIDHAINIALKLVREGRWSTPGVLRTKNHGSFIFNATTNVPHRTISHSESMVA